MEDQNQQQPQNQPQGSNNVKTSAIAVVVLLVLIAVYAFSQKKSSNLNIEPVNDDGAMDLDDDGDESIPQNVNSESKVNSNTNDSNAVNTNTTPEPVNQNSNTNQPVASSAYKDGSYSATGDYVSPGGAEQVGVTITLKDGVVVDSQFVVMASRPASKMMQIAFSENYKQYVIGKKIEDVHLTKVSSSSLTPGGFNNALEKIKAQVS